MNEKKEWPLSVTRGSVTVKIYRANLKGAYPFYQLVYYIAGKRKIESFTDLDEAKAQAALVATKLRRGDLDALGLSGQDRWRYQSAKDALAPHGVTVDVAAGEYARCLDLLKGKGALTDAVRYYLNHGAQELKQMTVPQVVAEFLGVKEKDGSSKVHHGDLKGRLNRFAKSFPGDIGSVKAGEIQDWLTDLGLSPKSVNNFHGSLSNLFKYASSSKRKYVAKANNPMTEVERVKDTGSAIEIFSPQELAKLLAHADEEILLFLVIGGFAGLRSAEFCRLDWKDVRFAAACIVVEAAKAKTASRRVLPMAPNLCDWLRPYEHRTGKVWKFSVPYLYEALEKVAKAAGVAWKSNALRHSFISYRVAETNDVAKVALEAGNSPQMVFKNYRQLVLPADAVAWDAIMPTVPVNTITLPAAQTA